MKIIFSGTSDYCLPVLEALHKNFDLKLVVTRPDKPFGRKKILTPSATKTWAEKNGVNVLTPATLKKDTDDRMGLIRLISQISPDLGIVSDYGLIIPEKIFTLPRLGTINVHFSRLPALRGPSPVQFTLLRGETEAWITIFKLESPPELEIKMDSGPVIFQQSYPISPDDTTQTLYTKLFLETSKVLPKILKSYILNPKSVTPQNHSQSTFCRFLTKDDGFIEWHTLQKAMNNEQLIMNGLPKIQQEAFKTLGNQKLSVISNSSLVISNFYSAVTPWPGMWTYYENQKSKIKNQKWRMKIIKCHLKDEKLVLDEVQFEGKNPISGRDLD